MLPKADAPDDVDELVVVESVELEFPFNMPPSTLPQSKAWANEVPITNITEINNKILNFFIIMIPF